MEVGITARRVKSPASTSIIAVHNSAHFNTYPEQIRLSASVTIALAWLAIVGSTGMHQPVSTTLAKESSFSSFHQHLHF